MTGILGTEWPPCGRRDVEIVSVCTAEFRNPGYALPVNSELGVGETEFMRVLTPTLIRAAAFISFIY